MDFLPGPRGAVVIGITALAAGVIAGLAHASLAVGLVMGVAIGIPSGVVAYYVDH